MGLLTMQVIFGVTGEHTRSLGQSMQQMFSAFALHCSTPTPKIVVDDAAPSHQGPDPDRKDLLGLSLRYDVHIASWVLRAGWGALGRATGGTSLAGVLRGTGGH